MMRQLMCLAVGLVALTMPADAQQFPARPITLINVFAAGGPSDIHMRASNSSGSA